jgi:hypothetical protein
MSTGKPLPVADRSGIEMTGRFWRPAAAHSKNHATPQPRVPAESCAADNRRWCYDNRCRRRYDDWRSGGDDDRALIGAASSVRIAVKAGATATFGIGAVESDEREQNRRRRDGPYVRAHQIFSPLIAVIAPKGVMTPIRVAGLAVKGLTNMGRAAPACVSRCGRKN